MENLEKKVISWAGERGLIDKDNSKAQLVKTMEELGEVSRAILKNDHDGLVDGIGDVLVTLVILARINDTDLKSCLSAAWHEIRNRQGKTVNGVFIKN